MSRVYTAGSRFDTFILTCILAETVLVMAMCAVMYYSGLHPSLTQLGTILIFIGVSAAAAVLLWLFGRYFRKFIRYEITSDCLVVSAGSRQERYPWTSFTAAYLDKRRKRDPLPVVFEAAGRTLYINQYVDGIYSLTTDILRHVGASASVDPELISLISNSY